MVTIIIISTGIHRALSIETLKNYKIDNGQKKENFFDNHYSIKPTG